MGRLYIAANLFAPGLIRPAAAPDDYGHDAHALHLVLQPMLLRPRGGGIDPGIDALALDDYLANWASPAPDRPAPMLVGEKLAERIQSGEFEAIPVPLPPGTRLKFAFDTDPLLPGGTWTDERTVGVNASNGQPVAGWDQLPVSGPEGWPAFAIRSAAMPLVRRYEDLGLVADQPLRAGAAATAEPTRQEAVRRWIIGLLNAMSQTAGDAPTWRKNPRLEAIWQQALGTGIAFSDTAGWDHWLADASGGAAPVVQLYPELIAIYNAIPPEENPTDPVLATRPPRFQFRPHEVSDRPDLFDGGLPIDGRAYLDALWSELAAQAALATGEGLSAVEQACGRFFGFGERLAWPTARLNGGGEDRLRRFMVLRQALDAGWFITNGVSLAGLVFRIDGLLGGAKLKSVSLKCLEIQLPGATAKDVEAWPGEKVPDLVERAILETQHLASDVPAARTIAFTPQWRTAYPPDGTAPSDMAVYWQAREGSLIEMQPPVVPAGKTGWFAVPPTLLDLVDDATRSAAGGGLALSTVPPRRSLRPADLVDAVAAKGRYLKLPGGLAPFNTGEGVADQATGRFDPIRVYSLRLDPLSEAEEKIAGWLGDLPGSGRQAAIWITLKDRAKPPIAIDLTSALVAPHPFDDAAILVFDDDPDPAKPGPLTLALGETEQGSASPSDAWVWPVEMVFAAAADEPFNIVDEPTVQGPSGPAPLRLRTGLVTRLGLSADRILQSLAVTAAPSFDPDKAHETDLQANYAADTNKLRMSIPGFAPSGEEKRDLLLSDPDALLPLPDAAGLSRPRPHEARGPVSSAGPQSWYWAAYHLDQDRDVSSLEEEAWRFHSWVQAGQQRRVAGYMEHQFGHRAPISEIEVDLRRSVDIVHPAEVAPRGRTAAEPVITAATATVPETVKRRPLIRFGEKPGERGTFEVRLYRKAVRLAIERMLMPEADPAGRGNSADGGRFTAIRAIYRTLAELRDAMTSDNAELIIEGWRFDSRRQPRSAGSVDLGLAEPTTAPDVIGSLDPLAPVTVAIRTSGLDSALAAVFAALDGPFARFVDTLERTAAPSATSSETEDIDWALLASAKLPNLHEGAHYVRGVLSISRDKDLNPKPLWKDAAFVPLQASLSEQQEGELATTARDELVRWLDRPTNSDEPSRLWKTKRLLESFPRPGATSRERADEHGLMLGDHAQFLIAPDGKVEANAWVSDLYYVPHAFLVPQAHPALRDRQGTSDFATWLVALAEALAAGGDPRGFVSMSGLTDAAARAALRRDAARIIWDPARPRDLVRRLDALLTRVERSTVGPNASAHERSLFDHVSAVVAATEQGGQDQRWGDVRLAMLKRRPTLFGQARALALAVFNSKVDDTPFSEDNFDPQLFSIHLSKRVVRDGEQADVALTERPTETERFDYTRFHLADAPFFVDVLPEASYDDLLLIDQTRYAGINPGDFDQLGLPRLAKTIDMAGGVLQRGDGAGVAAEQVIEGDGLPPPGVSGSEVNFVHYNPDWRFKDPEPQFLYVLPERRIPATPRTLARVLRRKDALAAQDDPEIGPSPIRLLNPSSKPDLDLSWSKANAGMVDGLSRITLPASEPEAFGRVPTPPAAGGPLWSHDKGPAGWQLLTTYGSHHWFSLGLERPAKSLAVNLEDDVFDLEVEFWSRTPPVEPEPERPTLQSEPLLNWFDYQRRLRAGETGLTMPAAVAGADVLRSLRNWLVEPTDAEPYASKTVLDPPDGPSALAGDGAVVRRAFRIRPPDGASNKQWRIDENFDLPGRRTLDDLGACLGFEIYGATDDNGSTPGYDQPVVRPFAVLRFSILDHPFHVARVRLRQVRNAVDINGDSRIDIDERFILSDRASVWSQKRVMLELSPAELEASGVRPEAGAAIYVETSGAPQAWLRRWLDGDPALAPDVGAAFERLMRLTLPDNQGKLFPLWEHGPLLSDLKVSGSVIQPFADSVLPQYGLNGRDAAAGGARDHEDIRQLLPLGAGSDLPAYLAGTLRPALIDTLEPLFVLTWRDGDDIPVFRTTLPMLVS